ncbi:MAG: MATE family efflux transporter [Christensenellales bacterium]
MKRKNKTDMNEQLASGKIKPLLIRMAIPFTIGQLVNALYSIVDRMYIGQMPNVGTAALSGLGLTFPIIMMVLAFAVLIGLGGAPLSSIKAGAGDDESARRYLGNAVTLLILSGIVLTVVFLIFLDPLLIAFGASENTLPYARDYLGIYLWGTVFVQLATGLNAFINSQGYATTGTITLVVGAVLNVVLDPIFIYTLGMGIKGAAVATVIAQAVSAAWVVGFLCSKHSYLRIQAQYLRLKWQVVKTTCMLGFSNFIFQVNESIVVIVINRLLRHYGGVLGDLHIASMAILASVSQIFFMPLKGIMHATQPLVSYNTGAKNHTRIREAIRYSRYYSVGSAAVMWALMMLIPRTISMAFTPDPELIALTERTMRLMFCTVFLIGMQMVNQNAFIAMGNTGYSFLFGIMRKVLLLIPLAFTLPLWMGIDGVYLAEAVSNVLTVIVTYIVFERYMNRLKHSFSQSM